MTFAAVTMVYNEATYLPIWCRHYGAAFGPENCYIIDHGSDDGSTRGLDGFNVVRIPRSPLDEGKRARFVSGFASNLLTWHDAVIHTDADEIAFADPDIYPDLPSLMRQAPHEVVNAIGFDVFHILPEEAPIDLTAAILRQRRWVRFSSSMCKAAVIKRPVIWPPGFHSADAPFAIDSLYLFHLRYFDLDLGIARLGKTRSMAWANLDASSHQRVADDIFRDWIEQAGRLPRLAGARLGPADEPLAGYLRLVTASEVDYRANTYNIDLHIFGNEMIEIPARFSGVF